jgi:hypothetical protein
MRVNVAYVAPGAEVLIAVELDDGATVADALGASRIAERFGVDVTSHGLAVFGKRANPDTLLVDGDRVEITRPLVCDPKTARRRRAARSR